MAPSSRDRLSVDLHGLKAALLARAQSVGVSPSSWVRSTLAAALEGPAESVERPAPDQPDVRGVSRVRLTLRMPRADAAAVLSAARLAGLHPGDYVADLLAGQPAPLPASDRAEHVAALVASCAEVSTLSRNLSHLVSLLRQGAYRPAEEYRPMLATLGLEVRAHLALVTRALADLKPRSDQTPRLRRRRIQAAGARP